MRQQFTSSQFAKLNPCERNFLFSFFRISKSYIFTGYQTIKNEIFYIEMMPFEISKNLSKNDSNTTSRRKNLKKKKKKKNQNI